MLRIAIDGTASAGKGSIARGVARELDLPYVDTGSMYRSIALMVIEANKNCHDVTDVLSVLDNVQFDFTWKSDELETWLNGRNVSSKIRSKEVGSACSELFVGLATILCQTRIVGHGWSRYWNCHYSRCRTKSFC